MSVYSRILYNKSFPLIRTLYFNQGLTRTWISDLLVFNKNLFNITYIIHEDIKTTFTVHCLEKHIYINEKDMKIFNENTELAFKIPIYQYLVFKLQLFSRCSSKIFRLILSFVLFIREKICPQI